MSQSDEQTADETGGRAGQCNTMQTSQDEQVRGYLESLTDTDFVDELREALGYARRLTGKNWTITITTEEIILQSQSLDRVRIPRPKKLRN